MKPELTYGLSHPYHEAFTCVLEVDIVALEADENP
jgi:hypothetical protein